MARATRGSGSVRKLPNGRWEATVSLGTDATGKRIRRSVSAATKAAAIARAHAVRADESAPVASDLTVAEVLALHAERLDAQHAAGVIGTSTRDGWRYATARCHDLAEVLVSRLTPAMIEAWVASLDGSLSTRRKTFQVLRAAITTAQRDGRYRGAHPFDTVASPTGAAPVVAAAPDDVIAAALADTRPRWRALWTVLVYTGMRQGEARVMQWSDMDPAYTQVRIEAAKTSAGVRIVPLHALVTDELHRWQPQSVGPYVFASSSGRPPDRWAVIAAFKTVTGGQWTPHSLRHAAATRLLSAGVPPHDVAALLGHSSASVTLDIYAHSGLDGRRAALERAFGDPLGGLLAD